MTQTLGFGTPQNSGFTPQNVGHVAPRSGSRTVASKWPILRPKPAISRLRKIHFGPGRVLGCPVAVSGPPPMVSGPPKNDFFCRFFQELLRSLVPDILTALKTLLDADEVNWRGGRWDTRIFWGSLGHFGEDLEPFWGGLGPAQGTPKRFWGPLGRFQGSSEVPRTSFGGVWGQFGVFWVPPPGYFGVFGAPWWFWGYPGVPKAALRTDLGGLLVVLGTPLKFGVPPPPRTGGPRPWRCWTSSWRPTPPP